MIDLQALNAYRDDEWEKAVTHGPALDTRGRRDHGCFIIPSPVDQQPLRCLASSARSCREHGMPPWDHVSISRADRLPNWDEMDYLYTIFFREKEVALQYHVPSADHVDHLPVLHLWCYHGLGKVPRPPSIMVGPDSAKGRKPKSGQRA